MKPDTVAFGEAVGLLVGWLVEFANTHTHTHTHAHTHIYIYIYIDVCVDENKTEFMSFKREGAISFLSGRPLKLIDRFTYLGSNISSIENDVNIRLVKAWNAIDCFLIIYKSDLSNEIKRNSSILYG